MKVDWPLHDRNTSSRDMEALREIGIGWTSAKSDLEAIRLFAAEGKLLLVVHTAHKVVVGAIDVDQPLNPERFQSK